MASLQLMRQAIASYRRASLRPDEDPVIGCVLLRHVFFVDEAHTLAAPPDFASNIVMGKTYDLADSSGSYLEAAIGSLLAGSPSAQAVPGPIFGDPRLQPHRLGQRAFAAMVLTAYERRCAVTGARIRPTLQSAHIRPVAQGGLNTLDNGVLLRSDVHTLFDQGYLGIDSSHRLRVSPSLRSEFGNGEEFYSRQGAVLASLPAHRRDRPSREALEWHMDVTFRAT